MKGFELVHPASLREAIAMLDTGDPSVRAFSGGTALMLMMKTGVFRPSRLVCLAGTETSRAAIAAKPDGALTIGALATLTGVEYSLDVIRFAPVIARAMKRLANVRVRNVARIGGSLAHGDPHMDLPPVLAALGAEVSIEGPKGQRRVAVENLYSGYYETVLTQGELIAAVHRDLKLTIILIEHRMDLVMAICPRLVVLNFGTKLTEGTQQEVQSNPAVLQAYLGAEYANVAGQ